MTERLPDSFVERDDSAWIERSKIGKNFVKELQLLMVVAQVAREDGEDREQVKIKESAALRYAEEHWPIDLSIRIKKLEGAEIFDLNRNRISEEPVVFHAHRLAGMDKNAFRFINDETGESIVIEDSLYSVFSAHEREFESEV